MALISQTEFAKLAGVTQPAIARAIKAGQLSVDGRKVDTTGQMTVEYLRRRGAIENGHEPAPTNSKTKVKKDHFSSSKRMVTDEVDPYLEDDDEPPSGGSVAAPPKGTKAYYDMELVKQRTFALGLKNMELVGKVFDREIFERGFWNPLESMFRQWQTDLPHTLAAMVYPMVAAGSSVSDVESTIRKHLSQTIKAAKNRMVRTLELMITPKR